MKKLQKGRSMIEMLGVLAIIGVLSIGGLAGYTMAMNRWRANTITDYVTRCVVVAQTKGVSGVPATGDCVDILSEAKPSFVDSVEIKGYDANTDDTRVEVGGVSNAVTAVIADKLGTRVSGVQAAGSACGTAGTFSGSNATFGAAGSNKVCFSFANK